jgi:uncharacterized membrane protein YedE/YeeE|tara:strand:+ start:64540 stop:64986 length:447 start_codon:yes stop_codon:yes gene_type:complete
MLLTLFLAWIAATTCMTGFSYLFSTILNENFKEPILLTDLLDKVFHVELPVWVGWLAHYLTGILFLVLLIAAYSLTNVAISVLWGIIFGAILGGIGIVMWKVLYKAANTDPPTHTRLFHLQLIIAHIFFGMAAIGVERCYDAYLKMWL